MSDITITCGSCGNLISVSEFVSAETLTCMKCKAIVPVPKQTPTGPIRPKLNVRVDEPPPPVQEPIPEKKRGWFDSRSTAKNKPASPGKTSNVVMASMPAIRKRVRKQRHSSWIHKVMPWIVFVIITLVLCYLRFIPGAMPVARKALMIQGAIWSLLFIHVSIVVFAFGEDPFQSILCALIPGYSAYYLFTQADQYILRALAAALLLAFGLDAGKAAQETWQDFYRSTNNWIQDKHIEK